MMKATLATLVVCMFACSEAAFDLFNPANSQMLVPEWGYQVHWTIAGDTITFGVESETEGWVGFGLADLAGASMGGADIILGYENEGGTVEIKDTYATGYSAPVLDTDQDWQFVAGKREGNVTMFAATRKLDLATSQDHPILLTNEQPIIMARGEMYGPSWGYHGAANRHTAFIDFRTSDPADPLAALKNDADVLTYDYMNNYTMSARRTQYVDIMTYNDNPATQPPFLQNHPPCKDTIQDYTDSTCPSTIADLGDCDAEMPGIGTIRDSGLCRLTCGQCDGSETEVDFETVQILGLEAIVRPESASEVHHFVVYGIGPNSPPGQRAIWSWAPGADSWVFPDACGFMMKKGDLEGIHLQTHYDNPTGKVTGVRETSGVRIYYTTKLRSLNCGMLQMGDGKIGLNGRQLPKGLSRSTFSCHTDMVPPGTVLHIFGSFLHMHLQGKRMWTTQYPQGDFTKGVDYNRNDFFDEAFQVTVKKNMTFTSGDRFTTTCIHDAVDGTVWGLGSEEEMCIDFVYYYPEIEGFNYCGNGDNGGVTELHTPLSSDSGGCWGKAECVGEEEDIPIIDINLDCLEDDPDGILESAGVTCPQLLEGYTCDVELNTINSAAPVGYLISVACPKSCEVCKVPEVSGTTMTMAPSSDYDTTATSDTTMAHVPPSESSAQKMTNVAIMAFAFAQIGFILLAFA